MRRTVSSRKIVGDETQVAHEPLVDRSDRALRGPVSASFADRTIAFEPMSEVDLYTRDFQKSYQTSLKYVGHPIWGEINFELVVLAYWVSPCPSL